MKSNFSLHWIAPQTRIVTEATITAMTMGLLTTTMVAEVLHTHLPLVRATRLLPPLARSKVLLVASNGIGYSL